MDNNEISFSDIKTRLDEILADVSSGDTGLDEAIDLFDEAVKLGMKASSLVECEDDAKLLVSEQDFDTETDLEGSAVNETGDAVADVADSVSDEAFAPVVETDSDSPSSEQTSAESSH